MHVDTQPDTGVDRLHMLVCKRSPKGPLQTCRAEIYIA